MTSKERRIVSQKSVERENCKGDSTWCLTCGANLALEGRTYTVVQRHINGELCDIFSRVLGAEFSPDYASIIVCNRCERQLRRLGRYSSIILARHEGEKLREQLEKNLAKHGQKVLESGHANDLPSPSTDNALVKFDKSDIVFSSIGGGKSYSFEGPSSIRKQGKVSSKSVNSVHFEDEDVSKSRDVILRKYSAPTGSLKRRESPFIEAERRKEESRRKWSSVSSASEDSLPSSPSPSSSRKLQLLGRSVALNSKNQRNVNRFFQKTPINETQAIPDELTPEEDRLESQPNISDNAEELRSHRQLPLTTEMTSSEDKTVMQEDGESPPSPVEENIEAPRRRSFLARLLPRKSLQSQSSADEVYENSTETPVKRKSSSDGSEQSKSSTNSSDQRKNSIDDSEQREISTDDSEQQKNSTDYSEQRKNSKDDPEQRNNSIDDSELMNSSVEKNELEENFTENLEQKNNSSAIKGLETDNNIPETENIEENKTAKQEIYESFPEPVKDQEKNEAPRRRSFLARLLPRKSIQSQSSTDDNQENSPQNSAQRKNSSDDSEQKRNSIDISGQRKNSTDSSGQRNNSTDSSGQRKNSTDDLEQKVHSIKKYELEENSTQNFKQENSLESDNIADDKENLEEETKRADEEKSNEDYEINIGNSNAEEKVEAAVNEKNDETASAVVDKVEDNEVDVKSDAVRAGRMNPFDKDTSSPQTENASVPDSNAAADDEVFVQDEGKSLPRMDSLPPDEELFPKTNIDPFKDDSGEESEGAEGLEYEGNDYNADSQSVLSEVEQRITTKTKFKGAYYNIGSTEDLLQEFANEQVRERATWSKLSFTESIDVSDLDQPSRPPRRSKKKKGRRLQRGTQEEDKETNDKLDDSDIVEELTEEEEGDDISVQESEVKVNGIEPSVSMSDDGKRQVKYAKDGVDQQERTNSTIKSEKSPLISKDEGSSLFKPKNSTESRIKDQMPGFLCCSIL